MTTTEPTGAADRPPGPPQQRNMRLVVFALIISMMLAMLDNMVVGTAMPTIVGELGGMEHLSWVVTAYALATAAATPIWGKLGDLYGRKGMFLTSIVIFLVGSVLSGAAQDMTQLIAFRAVQGLGAGGLMVGVMAIIGDLIPPRERGRYQGLMAGVMALGIICGPLLGGSITDHLGWRWAFYINLPLGAVALTMVALVLHLPRVRREARIDYLGAALLTVGIVSVVLVTTWGGTEYAWGSPVILGLVAAAVVALAAFLLVERRVAEPVLPPRIYRNRNFSLMSVLGFGAGFVMFGGTLYLPFFQQTVQGASATNSGLLLLPMMLATMAVSVVVGRRITATGKYWAYPVTGTALMAVGLYLLSTMDTGTGRVTSGLFMAVLGAGMGFLMQITMLIAQNSVDRADMGVASSATTLFRTLGGSFGAAVMGAVFSSGVRDTMREEGGAAVARVTETSAQLDAASLAGLPDAVREVYQRAVAAGSQGAFLLGAVVAAVCLFAALAVKAVPLEGAGPDPRAPGRTEEEPAAV